MTYLRICSRSYLEIDSLSCSHQSHRLCHLSQFILHHQSKLMSAGAFNIFKHLSNIDATHLVGIFPKTCDIEAQILHELLERSISIHKVYLSRHTHSEQRFRVSSKEYIIQYTASHDIKSLDTFCRCAFKHLK